MNEISLDAYQRMVDEGLGHSENAPSSARASFAAVRRLIAPLVHLDSWRRVDEELSRAIRRLEQPDAAERGGSA